MIVEFRYFQDSAILKQDVHTCVDRQTIAQKVFKLPIIPLNPVGLNFDFYYRLICNCME